MIIRKALASIEDTTSTSSDPLAEKNGSFKIVLSTPTRDRDGEEVKANEWKLPLPSRITMDVDHGMSAEKTVGSGVPSLDAAGRLVVEGTFASTSLGQTVRTLVTEGHISTTSVAFLRESSTDQKSGEKVITRELLNGAFVAIPANPEAVVMAAKSGARNSSSDQEMIQTIHDLVTALGAMCADEAEEDDSADVADDQKSVSKEEPEVKAVEADAAIAADVSAAEDLVALSLTVKVALLSEQLHTN